MNIIIAIQLEGEKNRIHLFVLQVPETIHRSPDAKKLKIK